MTTAVIPEPPAVAVPADDTRYLHDSPEYKALVARNRRKAELDADHAWLLAQTPSEQNRLMVIRMAELAAKRQREANAAYRTGGMRGFARYVLEGKANTGGEFFVTYRGQTISANWLDVDGLAELYTQLRDCTYKRESK